MRDDGHRSREQEEMSTERMSAGELYDALDPELVAARARARKLLGRFNADPERSALEQCSARSVPMR